MEDHVVEGRARLVARDGLHARPSIQVTKLANSLPNLIEIAISPTGPWVDAKSPIQLMRLKAPQGAYVHIRVSGPKAAEALGALLALFDRNFGESSDRGRVPA